MKLTYDKQEKFTILTLNEENLNSVIAPEIKSEFISLQSNGTENLIMDFSEVKYVDSSGLSAILTAERIFKEKGTFVMVGVKSDSVKKLISISRLDNILNIVPTIEEAKEFVIMSVLENELKSEIDTDE